MGEPNTNIFISDLPAEVDDAKLAEVFGQYGTVTWSKVMGSKGKPTNAAIVEFSSVDEAQWVVENLNGNLAQGIATPISVMFKREKSKGKGDDKGKGKGGGYGKVTTPSWTPPAASFSPYGNGKAGAASAPSDTNVFISDLPAEVDDAKLAEVFGQYGTVTWSKVMVSKGKPTNAAIVEFGSADEAQWVVENLNGNLAQGISTPINIAFKREKSKGKGDGKGKGGGFGKVTNPSWSPAWSGNGKGGGKW